MLAELLSYRIFQPVLLSLHKLREGPVWARTARQLNCRHAYAESERSRLPDPSGAWRVHGPQISTSGIALPPVTPGDTTSCL